MKSEKDKRLIGDVLERFVRVKRKMPSSLESFEQDEDAQEIVAYCFMIIGEAAGKVSKRTRNANPDIPWARLEEYRNELIHEYDILDLEGAWAFVHEELPDLERLLKRAVVPSRPDREP